MIRTRWAVALTSLFMSAAMLSACGSDAEEEDAASKPDTATSGQKDRIELPKGWLPEGITTDGTSLYSGSRADGSILKIDLEDGSQDRFDGASGRIAVGVDYDEEREILWVAGGAGKEVRAQDADTGEVLTTYEFPSSADRFVNDLTVTATGVYATDSLSKELLVIPLGASEDVPEAGAAKVLPLTGDLTLAEGNNLNGIVEMGESLVAVQSNTGSLLSIDPASGTTRTIDLGGITLTNGDGLEVGDGVLYAVQNRLNKIAVLELDDALAAGTVVDTIEAADFGAEVDVPATVALVKDSLYAVNARFTVADPATADYWITRANAYAG